MGKGSILILFASKSTRYNPSTVALSRLEQKKEWSSHARSSTFRYRCYLRMVDGRKGRADPLSLSFRQRPRVSLHCASTFDLVPPSLRRPPAPHPARLTTYNIGTVDFLVPARIQNSPFVYIPTYHVLMYLYLFTYRISSAA